MSESLEHVGWVTKTPRVPNLGALPEVLLWLRVITVAVKTPNNY